MENYKVELKDYSYTVEIPFSDHMHVTKLLNDVIPTLETKKREMQSFLNDLPKYVEEGAMTQEASDYLKSGREYQIEEIQKRIDVAVKFSDSIYHI